MKVLSLFDGMSCGQIALRELGYNLEYYASEIDRYAIQQTQLNFPDTKQLGDVTKVSGYDLPKIDLLIGGSPCQGFSFAGKRLNFQDPRSKLFFEFVRILKECREKNPDIKFMLENVNMKKSELGVISQQLGVFPVNINSSLVSAQNRDRWYWTNIKTEKRGLFGDVWSDIPQPNERQIYLTSVIDEGYVDRDKSYCIDANYFKGTTINEYLNKSRRQVVFMVKEQRSEEGRETRRRTGTNSFRDKEYVVETDNSPCLQTSLTKDHVVFDTVDFRKLTPTECARLQTIPDWYKWNVSDTQQYKMLGNGWTVEVIKHIFSFLECSKDSNKS